MLWERSAVCLHTRCEMVILCVFFLSQHRRSLYVRVICPVKSQRWCFQTNAVTVRARYLPCFLTPLVLSKEAVSVCAHYLTCFLTTLVLSHKCSQCTCTLFVPRWCCQKTSFCMCTLFAVLSQRWCCQINQSLYVHVICCPLTTLVLSDEAVSARHVFCSSRLAELPVVTAW